MLRHHAVESSNSQAPGERTGEELGLSTAAELHSAELVALLLAEASLFEDVMAIF
jgi:hypothetical protein